MNLIAIAAAAIILSAATDDSRGHSSTRVSAAIEYTTVDRHGNVLVVSLSSGNPYYGRDYFYLGDCHYYRYPPARYRVLRPVYFEPGPVYVLYREPYYRHRDDDDWDDDDDRHYDYSRDRYKIDIKIREDEAKWRHSQDKLDREYDLKWREYGREEPAKRRYEREKLDREYDKKRRENDDKLQEERSKARYETAKYARGSGKGKKHDDD